MNFDSTAALRRSVFHHHAVLRVHRPDPLQPTRDFDNLERLAFQYGRYYDSYIATDTESKRYFWTSDREGAVCMMLRGKHAFIFGGLLAAPEKWPTLLDELIEDCQQNRRTLSFFNIGDQEVPLLRERGFEVTKFGEEPIVDLGECTWRGKHYEWVRRQTNFCTRNGLVCEEIHRDELTGDAWNRLMDELEVISQHFLEEKANDEGIRNIISRFSPDLIFRQRLFVARNPAQQRIEAFIMCNPCLDGDMWAVESYRRRRDAVRGVIPFLMHQAMVKMKDEGVDRVSLSMLPFLRCNERISGDSWLARHLIVLTERYFNSIYDARGLYHFKSRFRPQRYENRYVCARPGLKLSTILAAFNTWGMLRINPSTTARKCIRQLRNRATRLTLATPQTRRAS